MQINVSSSRKAFKSAIAILVLFAVMISLQFVRDAHEYISLLTGAIVFAIGIIALYGTIESCKSFREKTSARKAIGIVVNFGFLGLFIFAIVANVMDMIEAFG